MPHWACILGDHPLALSCFPSIHPLFLAPVLPCQTSMDKAGLQQGQSRAAHCAEERSTWYSPWLKNMKEFEIHTPGQYILPGSFLGVLRILRIKWGFPVALPVKEGGLALGMAVVLMQRSCFGFLLFSFSPDS